MKTEYNEAKNTDNIAKHGISFELVAELDWSNSVTKIDARFAYGETRYISYCIRNNRLHVLVWTKRNGVIRPISFRKANKRERKQYEEI